MGGDAGVKRFSRGCFVGFGKILKKEQLKLYLFKLKEERLLCC
jgi:hypothetical protein